MVKATISGTSHITADGGITLRALHNRDENGNEISDNQAWTHASAPGGALIGGNGADATSTANADLEAAIKTGVTLEAIGGTIQILALAYNDAYAESDGIIGGGVAVGASLADATTNGTFKAYFSGTIADSSGTGNGAANLTILVDSINIASADALAVAGGVAAGAGADADATASPTLEAYISDGTVYLSDELLIQAFSDSKATADALGVAGGRFDGRCFPWRTLPSARC